MKPPTTKKLSRVLGIDPGFDRLGLAVIEGDSSRPSYVWSDCVTPPKGPAYLRLAAVSKAVEEALSKHAPDIVAVETLFFSTNRKTALSVAEARGAILAAIGRTGIPLIEVSPAAVKIAVTGHGSADKSAVMNMIPRLISLPTKKRLDDEFDAIAAAITGLSSTSQRMLG